MRIGLAEAFGLKPVRTRRLHRRRVGSNRKAVHRVAVRSKRVVKAKKSAKHKTTHLRVRTITNKLPYVIKVTSHRVGKSAISYDKRRKALKAGLRKSRTGRIYYENRRNRSDLHPYTTRL